MNSKGKIYILNKEINLYKYNSNKEQEISPNNKELFMNQKLGFQATEEASYGTIRLFLFAGL